MSEAVKTKTRNVLRKTRDLFQATHWGQGEYTAYSEEKEKQVYCAVGGIRYITTGDTESSPEYYADMEEYRKSVSLVAMAIDADLAEQYVAVIENKESAPLNVRDAVVHLEQIIIGWNDEGVTDVEPVIAVFDQALEQVPARR